MAKRQRAAERPDAVEARQLFDHVFDRFEAVSGPSAKASAKLFPRGIELITLKVAIGEFVIEFTVAGPDSRKPDAGPGATIVAKSAAAP